MHNLLAPPFYSSLFLPWYPAKPEFRGLSKVFYMLIRIEERGVPLPQSERDILRDEGSTGGADGLGRFPTPLKMFYN
uniref:Uncharacterized protein n=1 Tax=Steinernema glaseri TaxID=37863 RepID=A0A1I7Z0C6_9BILA